MNENVEVDVVVNGRKIEEKYMLTDNPINGPALLQIENKKKEKEIERRESQIKYQ